MTLEPLGDSAYIIRGLELPAYDIAARLNDRLPRGVLEATASYDTVGLYVDETFDPAQPLVIPDGTEASPKSHEIPVCYLLGDDFVPTAEFLGMEPEALIAAHTGETYRCYAVGFCPGFPYLGYLPDAIKGVPRHASPRKRVEPGSVAITGNQTAVYPLPKPGGWRLIGRTPYEIVDERDRYFPITAGDLIRFHPIEPSEYERLKGRRL